MQISRRQQADVDTVCVDKVGYIIPVVNVSASELELEPAGIEDVLACRRIILEGGADPTVYAWMEIQL